jgi:hypothetical protein
VENWAQALGHAINRYGRRFVLIGNEDERAATEEIRARMGAAAAHCENLCGLCENLDLAIGLIHHSSAYLGRDTGPMHIAAALGKPVIAVFGGGTWPRFTPAAKSGTVLTVPLPCAGCDWRCHLADSYCVKRVPASAVFQAIDALEAGGTDGLHTQHLAPDSSLLTQLAREGAASARKFWRTTRRQEREIQILAAANASAGREQLAWEIERLRNELRGHRDAETEALAGSTSVFAPLRADIEKAFSRFQEAETARAEAVRTVDKIRLELDSIKLLQVNLQSQLEMYESERTAGRAVVERQAAQLREAAEEMARKAEEYEKLLALMHGITAEFASLSSQLVNSRRTQSQVESKCVDLQHTIETSLALKLARSLHWVLGPVVKLMRRSSVHAPTSGRE